MSSIQNSPDITTQSDPTSVFVCYSTADETFAHQLTLNLSDLGFRVHDIGLTFFDAYRVKVEQAIANCDYYIVVFSFAFFSEKFANEQLNVLFDSYVFRPGRGGKVLPIVREMSWPELRKKSPLFGTMRPMDGGKSDDDVRRLAKLFYGVVKKDGRSLPASSNMWEWEEDVITKCSNSCLAVRLVQLVDSTGSFSTVLVTDHQPNSKDQSGDLIVQVDGESFVGLSLDALKSIAKRCQTNSVYLRYQVRRRKSPTTLLFYFDSIRRRAQQKQHELALPTAETIDAYWSRTRISLNVTTPLVDLGLESWKTPDGADYVLVTNPPTGYPLLYGDRVISIDNNYIDLTHIDLSTINKKLRDEQNQVKLTVWKRRSPDDKMRNVKMLPSNKKLWPHQLEQCLIYKTNGEFGLTLMRIKDPITKQALPVIKSSAASGLFYGDLIVMLADKEITDYNEALKMFHEVADKQEVTLGVRQPNKERLVDHIQRFYTEDSNASVDTEDSDYSSEGEQEGNTMEDVNKFSHGDSTAIVGQQLKRLDLEDSVTVNEEQASTPFPRQVTELEGEQDADPRSQYCSESQTEFQSFGELTHKNEQAKWSASVLPQKILQQRLISLASETQSGCGRQKLAEDLIRKQWRRLVAKLDADDVIDHLYEQKIISFNEMEKVNDTENISRKRKTLLKFIVKRPWVDGVQFAKILSGSKANHELGRMLLRNAGSELVGNPDSVDDSSLPSDLHSFVQSAVEGQLEQKFKSILDMMKEVADCLTDKCDA